jgi:hypothetical protein
MGIRLPKLLGILPRLGTTGFSLIFVSLYCNIIAFHASSGIEYDNKISDSNHSLKYSFAQLILIDPGSNLLHQTQEVASRIPLNSLRLNPR